MSGSSSPLVRGPRNGARAAPFAKTGSSKHIMTKQILHGVRKVVGLSRAG